MKKDLTMKYERAIKMGFVLDARESDEASKKSYDDMREVGIIRISDSPEIKNGDDLNDAPYNCNGGIYDGEEVVLEKGDIVIIIKQNSKVALSKEVE